MGEWLYELLIARKGIVDSCKLFHFIIKFVRVLIAFMLHTHILVDYKIITFIFCILLTSVQQNGKIYRAGIL